MLKTLIVNLFAGPGAGKSTCAWRLAGELTRQGLRVEYVPEYAKELVWDNRMDLLDGSLEHQRMIFEEQNHRIQRLVGKVDVALPRGGAKLINMVVQTAKVPIIQTGAGICHLYVDESADLEMALNLAWNAKTQRPGACNAIETIVVNEKILNQFIPRLVEKFAGKVELRLDEKSYKFVQNVQNPAKIKKAADEDFGFEFLDFICSVKTVSTLDEAIDFINSHNTKHSECIVTNNRQNSRIFQSKIDAACVYVNASTRFTDGGEFGFGAELGISTQKLHARGPMGIKALTTTKYLIDGDGQIR